MNEISAVKDQGRRNCGEQPCPKNSWWAQTVFDQGKKQEQPQAKKNGDPSQAGIAVVVEVRSASQTLKGKSRVEEGRPVMLVGIVLVALVIPKLAELNCVDGLIIVH